MSKQGIYRIVAAIVLGTSLISVGCSRTRHPVVEVKGKIQFADGKPLPAGTQLIFNPSEGRAGTASATIEADGSFSVEHVNGSSGAELGKYSVTLVAPPDDPTFHKIVPKEYCEGGVLAVEVKEGMAPLDLKVKPADSKAKKK
jgi:hypothetical protein